MVYSTSNMCEVLNSNTVTFSLLRFPKLKSSKILPKPNHEHKKSYEVKNPTYQKTIHNSSFNDNNEKNSENTIPFALLFYQLV